jgi:hypothetical protein
MSTTRDFISRLGLTTVIAALSLFCSPIASGDSPAGTPPALTTDQIISELQSSGFEAKVFSETPLPPGAISQVLTGASGARILIIALGCPAPNADHICALAFHSFFPQAPAVSAEVLSALNAVTFAKVLAQMGTDGKLAGFRVFYAYPCAGFPDAKFVPMVLRNFGDGVANVVGAYRRSTSPMSSGTGAAGKAPDAHELTLPGGGNVPCEGRQCTSVRG